MYIEITAAWLYIHRSDTVCNYTYVLYIRCSVLCRQCWWAGQQFYEGHCVSSSSSSHSSEAVVSGRQQWAHTRTQPGGAAAVIIISTYSTLIMFLFVHDCTYMYYSRIKFHLQSDCVFFFPHCFYPPLPSLQRSYVATQPVLFALAASTSFPASLLPCSTPPPPPTPSPPPITLSPPPHTPSPPPPLTPSPPPHTPPGVAGTTTRPASPCSHFAPLPPPPQPRSCSHNCISGRKSKKLTFSLYSLLPTGRCNEDDALSFGILFC